MEKKALIQIQIFKLAYEDYVNKYKYYNEPENINIEKIKPLIIQWKIYIPEDKQFMYQIMINIISSLNNNAFEKNYKSYREQCKDAKMDPRKIASFGLVYIIITNKDVMKQKMNFWNKVKLFLN